MKNYILYLLFMPSLNYAIQFIIYLGTFWKI